VFTLALALLAFATLACGDDDARTPTTSTGGTGGSGGCPPELCGPVACADGFVADDYGCLPILPDAPCVGATMALPGDTSCKPIATCGDAPWGDIPVEPNTVYVDGSDTGGAADGTAMAPFTTISEALAVAEPSAIVAIAEGQYAESLTVITPVRLWGRCAALVHLQPLDIFDAAVDLQVTAADSEIHGLSITGSMQLLGNTRFEESFVSQTPDNGLFALSAEVLIRRSVFDDNAKLGILMVWGALTFEDSVVRANAARAFGPAVIGSVMPGEDASLTIRDSVIQGLTAYGAVAAGAHVDVERSVIRDIRANGDRFGDGIALKALEDGTGATGRIVDTFIGETARAGVANFVSAVSLERSRFECNLINLNGEEKILSSPVTGPFSFDDRGENRCGCGDERQTCTVLSSGLSPPDIPAP